MSWSFEAIGSKKAVIHEVKNAKGYGDESQLADAKAFIVAELEKTPEPREADGQWAANGIHVSASGSHDASTRYLRIEVKCVRISKEPA